MRVMYDFQERLMGWVSEFGWAFLVRSATASGVGDPVGESIGDPVGESSSAVAGDALKALKVADSAKSDPTPKSSGIVAPPVAKTRSEMVGVIQHRIDELEAVIYGHGSRPDTQRRCELQKEYMSECQRMVFADTLDKTDETMLEALLSKPIPTDDDEPPKAKPKAKVNSKATALKVADIMMHGVESSTTNWQPDLAMA